MSVTSAKPKLRKVESKTKDFNLFYAETKYLRRCKRQNYKKTSKMLQFINLYEKMKAEKSYKRFGIIKYNADLCTKQLNDMSRKECIDLLKNCSDTLKRDYGITSLRLFGSTARGEQKDGSDVDVFVETLTPNPFLLMEAKEYLEKSTGRPVDIIRNHCNQNLRLRKRIERDGVTVF